jgi:hypothetical protein
MHSLLCKFGIHRWGGHYLVEHKTLVIMEPVDIKNYYRTTGFELKRVCECCLEVDIVFPKLKVDGYRYDHV